jgi:hypothetical protein
VKKRDARSMTRLVAALAAVSVAVLVPRSVSAVTVFRCDESGHITYQGEPCKSSGKRIELPTVPVSPSASTKAVDDAERLRAAVAAQAAARRAAEVSAEVADLNAEIQANETKRQSELAVLQARLDHVAVNMAGAPWERTAARNEVQAQMQTVADRYEQKNRALRDRIAQLQGAATTNASTPAGRGRDPAQP